MADRDMTKILSSMEQDLTANPPVPVNPSTGPAAYAPPRERNAAGRGTLAGAADSLQQVQSDMRRAIQELEIRLKAVLDELKRVVG